MTTGPSSPAQPGRWRAGPRQASRSQRVGKLARVLVLLAIAALGAAIVVGILVAPLFRWQTAALTLLIDQYELGTIEPVPFGSEDSTAFRQVLSGRLGGSLGGEVLDLTGLESGEGLRELLLPRMRSLDLRPKDVLIAYVRSQAIVAPPLTATAGDTGPDPVAGRACFLAADLTVSGPRPRELVPIRDVVEAVGAAPPFTTLHVLDLGDLNFEPRLGVLANMVPRALDADFAKPQRDARYHNWVLGSHDLFQQSAVSAFAGRTYFSRAVELAFDGAADEPPWGDDDGMIELHEVVHFVKAWTAEWVRRATGGRAVQTPVLWKLGVGRIAVADLPRDLPLLRRSRPKASAPATGSSGASPAGTEPGGASKTAEPAPTGSQPARQPAPVSPEPNAKPAVPPQPKAPIEQTSAQREAAADKPAADGQSPAAAGAGNSAPAAGSKPDSAAAQSPPAESSPGQEKPAPARSEDAAPATEPVKKPAAPPPPPPPPRRRPAADAWEALDRLANRQRRPPYDSQSIPGNATTQAVVVDFAPHVWVRLFALVASADARRRGTGPIAERAAVAFEKIGADLSALEVAWHEGAEAAAVLTATAAGIRLQNAMVQAQADGFVPRWGAAPAQFTAAVAARNDALMLLRTLIDLNGRAGGGQATPPIDPSRINTLLDRVAQLTKLIRRSSRVGQAEASVGLDPLAAATRSLTAEATIATELIRGVVRSVLPDEAGQEESRGFEAWGTALRSPLLGPDLRERIIRRLTATHERTEPAAAGGDAPPHERSLAATGSVPAVFEFDEPIDRMNLEFIAGHALRIAGLAEASIGIDSVEVTDIAGLRDLAGDIVAIRRAAAALPETGALEAATLDRIAALGGLVAQLEARVAGLAGTMRNEDGTLELSLDDTGASLLRLLDSRDVAGLNRPLVAEMPAWTPRKKAGLAFEPPGERRLSTQTPLVGRLALPEGRPLPPDAVLEMAFDPADIRVVLEGGRELRPSERIAVRDLAIVNARLLLRIVANRDRTVNETGAALLRIAIDSTTVTATADLEFELPARRDIACGVRRIPTEPGMLAPAAVAGRLAPATAGRLAPAIAGRVPGRMRFATRSIGTATSILPLDAPPQAERLEVDLVAVPGATSGWEIGLENRADIPRTFAARLHSLPIQQPLNSEAGRTRAELWSEFCTAIESGSPVPDPLATIEKVSLEPQSAPVLLAFPPPPKAELPPPPAAGSPAVPAAAASPPPIGPDFALVLEETTPGEPRRLFLVRLMLSVEHPRRRLRATATWKRDERVVAVRIEPADGADASLLPPEGLRVALEPLPTAPLAAPQPLGLRRAATVLTRTRPSDTLTAAWQGSDAEARAWLSVSVNGYPRAFVFIVDCSAASDGIPQNPQDDFRAIAFAGPRPVVPQLVKAPADALPITLLIDAPPDVPTTDAPPAPAGLPPGREPVVALAFRSVRAGGMIAEGTQTVWTQTGDRQVTYTSQPAQGSVALAVRADVADWSIAPTGEGYVDLDLVAEATLLVPGAAAPRKDARTYVMDGRPPRVEVPPLVNATVGRPLVVPVRAIDDPRESFALRPGTHIPGVSGVARVEWALDPKGDSAPEAWTPAVGLGGGSYELRIDTLQLPPGTRIPLLVRATDRVGLANPPSRVWVDTAVAAAKGQINGRVVLQNRGERGVLVRIDGPKAPPPQRSGTDGRFTFSNLDPGTYTLKATGPVRNKSYASEATPAVVPAPPAPSPTVTLELK